MSKLYSLGNPFPDVENVYDVTVDNYEKVLLRLKEAVNKIAKIRFGFERSKRNSSKYYKCIGSKKRRCGNIF